MYYGTVYRHRDGVKAGVRMIPRIPMDGSAEFTGGGLGRILGRRWATYVSLGRLWAH
jgi:hypothetical protein